MKRIILATQNAKKGRELAELAAGRFTVQTLADLDVDPDVVEDQDTFEGNARTKLDQIVDALLAAGHDLEDVRAVIADDSGIVVDALEGAPGVRSARFAADHGAGEGDQANNDLLLRKLDGVPHALRTARYACAICVRLLPEGEHRIAFGTVEGHIATDEQGEGGFGYDPLFVPVDYPDRRMAEITAAQKHAISHRGKAMREALGWL